MHLNYHKNSKNWDMYNNYHSCSKIETILFNSTVIHPKDGDGMANSADPDQTAPFQAVWSGSQTCLSQRLEVLQQLAIT